jgi:hypothetical protein
VTVGRFEVRTYIAAFELQLPDTVQRSKNSLCAQYLPTEGHLVCMQCTVFIHMNEHIQQGVSRVITTVRGRRCYWYAVAIQDCHDNYYASGF